MLNLVPVAALITPAACRQLLEQLASATSLAVIEARQHELIGTLASFSLCVLAGSPEWDAFFAATRSLHVPALCNSLRLVVAAGGAHSELPPRRAVRSQLKAVAWLLQAHTQRLAAVDKRDPTADEAARLAPMFVAEGAPGLLAQASGLLARTLRDRQGDEAYSNHWQLAAQLLALSASQTGVFPARQQLDALQPASSSAQLNFIPIAAIAVLQLQRLSAELAACPPGSSSGSAILELPQTRHSHVSDVLGVAIQMAKALDAAGPSRGKMLVPDAVLDSPDVTLLLMAFTGLAVQHCHQHAAARHELRPAGVAADHELLLRALHLPGLIGVSESAFASFCEQPGDLELRLAADAAIFCHHYKLNAARVAAQQGKPAAEPVLDGAVPAGTPAPVLLTLIEAAQLASDPELLVAHIAFLGGHLTAAALASAAPGGATQQQVTEAVLLRLAPVAQRALRAQSGRRDPQAAAAARTLQGTYAALLGPPDAGRDMLVSRSFAAAAGSNAAVCEASIRAFQQQLPPGARARPQEPDWLCQVMSPIRRILASLVERQEEPRLSSVVAADPAAAKAVFSLLATMLKVAQQLTEHGMQDSSVLIPALSDASFVSCIAARASFPSYEPCEPVPDPPGSHMHAGASGLAGAGSASSTSSSTSPDALPWVALMGRALRCMGNCYDQLYAAGLSTAAGGEGVNPMISHCPAMFVAAVHWLGGALAELQLPGEPNGAAAAMVQLQQQQAQLQALLDLRTALQFRDAIAIGCPASAVLVQAVVSAEAAGLACELGASVCAAMPVPGWCNNPDCTDLGRLSEAQLVGRRFCTSCVTAKYCSTTCHHAHWKAHKKACKRLSASNAN